MSCFNTFLTRLNKCRLNKLVDAERVPIYLNFGTLYKHVPHIVTQQSGVYFYTVMFTEFDAVPLLIYFFTVTLKIFGEKVSVHEP